MTDTTLEQQQLVAGVRFHRVGKVYHFDFSAHPDVKPGDFVIVETARGRQMGEIMAFAPAEKDLSEYKPIMRPATPRDLVLKQDWESKQDDALMTCQKRAKEIGYPGVKIIAALYNYDGTMLTFLFTGEDKVNVNKLWSDMSRTFNSHVEMRQIGPRDVAKLLGGFGACGIMRCCSTFLTDFSPISIKMAKTQGISLNPSEITGMCGRLRCCLVYEYEQYVKARQQLPRKNKRIGTPFGEARVIDIHPLQDAVTVFVDDTYHLVKREEIVPLDELEALAKKAKAPCDKHGDGPCECGAKPGKQADNAEADADEDDDGGL